MSVRRTTNNVYLQLNYSDHQIMRLLFILLISIFVLPGCKDKKISPQYLTNVSVIRETEETNNAQKALVGTTSQKPATIISPATDAISEVSGQPSSSQYHIIVRSYNSSKYSEAKEMVRKLKEQGYPAMLVNKDKRFRVSIEHFNNKAEADNACEEYRKITEKNDIWVLFLK